MNEAALTLQRLASLLGAGLSLAQAKQELVDELAALEPAVAAQIDRLLALAERYGSSLTEVLAELASDYRRRSRLQDRIEVISALPKSTANLVAWLPIGCLLAAQLMGLNPINATLHNPVAAVSLASGLLLLWLNRKIMSRLVTRTHVKVFNEGQDLNQLAEVTLSLQAGLPVRRILEAGVAAGVGAGVGAQVRKSLELAERNGLAALGLLRSQLTIEADQLSMTVETEVERLQLRLLVPVGLLVLPALVLLAVVPTAIALLSN